MNKKLILIVIGNVIVLAALFFVFVGQEPTEDPFDTEYVMTILDQNTTQKERLDQITLDLETAQGELERVTEQLDITQLLVDSTEQKYLVCEQQKSEITGIAPPPRIKPDINRIETPSAPNCEEELDKLADTTSKYLELETQNRDLKASVVALEESVDKLQKTRTDLLAEISELENAPAPIADTSNLDSRISNLDKKIKLLEQENRDIKFKNEQLLADNNEIKLENNQLKLDNADVIAKNTDLTAKNNQLASENIELTSNNNTITSKLNALERETTSTASVKEQLALKNSDAELQVEQLQLENSNMSSKVEQLSQEKINIVAQKEQVVLENARLLAQIEQLKNTAPKFSQPAAPAAPAVDVQALKEAQQEVARLQQWLQTPIALDKHYLGARYCEKPRREAFICVKEFLIRPNFTKTPVNPLTVRVIDSQGFVQAEGRFEPTNNTLYRLALSRGIEAPAGNYKIEYVVDNQVLTGQLIELYQ